MLHLQETAYLTSAMIVYEKTKIHKSLQREIKINDWGGIIGEHVLGPIFLPQPLNVENYTNFLPNKLANLFEGLIVRRDTWFMQDIF